jgi:hypothetical protein
VRHRRLMSVLLIVVSVAIGACGGDDDNDAARSPTPSNTPSSPPPTATPGGSAGDLPPAFVQCMADQGFDVSSSADIHSAPPEVLQLCFGTLHGGGG